MNTDLKIEIYPVQPKSGQHVGLIPTGVKITHLPSGLEASCQAARSQMQNREICKAMIRAGLECYEKLPGN